MTAGRSRGQTMPDFVVAVGIFILALAFVVAFTPQLLAPHGGAETALVADRAAADLTGTHLAGDAPGTLNATCTLAFFTGSGGSGCPFDPSRSVTEQLGVQTWYAVNVTLRRNVTGGPRAEVLCGDGGTVGPCGTTRLARGPALPDRGRSVATARRAVAVGGNRAILEVNVWT